MRQESRNLDVLRAIAVLAVLADHMALTFGFEASGFAGAVGHTGVLIFFVHTCKVLLLSLERTHGEKVCFTFYVRRAFRIYPLSVTCILLVLVFRIPELPWRQFEWIGNRDIAANLALIQNVTHGKDVLVPLWSLPWEIQMYACLPAIYLVLKRWGSPGVAVGSWFLVCALLYGLKAAHLPVIAYYLEYSPCFFGGVIAYQAAKEWRPRLPGIVWPPAVVFLISVHSFVWTGPTSIGGIPVRGLGRYLLCFALGMLIPLCRELSPSRFTRYSRTIAKYSYGIYLFHCPLLWLAFVKLSALPVFARFAVFCALIILVPWIAFRWLESPCIEYGRRLASRMFSGSVPHVRQTGALSLNPELRP